MKKILVAEDDENSRILLERFLKKKGYTVDSAGNGVEALKLARQSKPDMIISDIMMPEMDGFMLCRLIKEDATLQGVPFFFYTATYVEQQDEALALELGASQFIIKPMDYPKLLKIIRDTFHRNDVGTMPVSKQTPKSDDELQQMYARRINAKLYKKIRELEKERLALRESEGKYRILFERELDAIFIYDPDTNCIIDANEATSDMYGYNNDELIGMSCLNLSAEVEKTASTINSLLRDGEINVSHRLHSRKDGLVFPVDIRAYTTTIRGKMLSYVICKDITKRIKAEDKNREFESQLRQLQKNEALGSLAGGIAHDFNNILVPILGYAEMLEDELSPDSEFHEHTNMILTAAKRARDLVKQILTFSRQTEQNIRPLKPNLIIKEVAKLVRSTIPTFIKIEKNIDPKTWTILSDPTQLHQVAMNLITNAYHAMEESGGTLTIRLQNIEKTDIPEQNLELGHGPHVLLSIADTGIGIDSIALGKIFDPYFTSKPKGKGTGLGLSVVHGIVKSHGGDISVSSCLGQGATFNIYIPAIKNEQESEYYHGSGVIKGGSERILLVDDEEIILQTEKEILGHLGYKVESINSSVAALEAVITNPDSYDLVISDMNMPNMTGDQLAQKILNVRSTLPIIICTGFSSKVTPETVKSIGVKALLMKPIIKSKLASTVRNVLDGVKST